jgi:hypothetical protein
MWAAAAAKSAQTARNWHTGSLLKMKHGSHFSGAVVLRIVASVPCRAAGWGSWQGHREFHLWQPGPPEVADCSCFHHHLPAQPHGLAASQSSGVPQSTAGGIRPGHLTPERKVASLTQHTSVDWCDLV